MLRRLSEASSLFSRGPPTSTDPPPPLPSSESSQSLSSAALTEALSYDLVTSPQPTRVAHAKEDLRHALDDLQQASPGDVETRLSALATIQLVLQEHDVQDVQSAFVTLGGFEVVVGALAAIDGAPRSDQVRNEKGGDDLEAPDDASQVLQDDDVRFHLATLIFHVLHLALRLPANSDSLSFPALASALDLSGLLAPDASLDDKARSLSLLWAFLVGDFAEGASAVLVVRSRVVERLERQQGDDEQTPSTALDTAREVVAARRAQDVVEAAVHPAVAPLLLDLADSHLDPTVEAELRLRLTVVALVTSLLDRRDGEKSAVGLGEAGLLRTAFERVLGTREGGEVRRGRVEGDEREIWVEMTRLLLGSTGATTQDARRLFEAAGGRADLDDELMQLLLDALPGSRAPPCVEFDFGQAQTCNLSLRSLGRPFPPPTHGYTLLAWICVDAPPLSSPLIIFGATDPSSRTFFELALLPSMRLAAQTSLRTPPVEFADYTLSAGSFHHVALVHQRPKFVAQSTCSLYVDGELVDSVKVAYPASPPHEWDVSAYFGTPSERAAAPMRTGDDARATSPRWKLGPSWLVHGELQADFLEVCSRLGPRYAGTFQDVLGRFLTNSSASALNIRLDTLSRDSTPTRGSSATASSPLMYALRHRGSAVVPEHRIYFALSATNLLTASASASETVKLASAAKGPAIVNAAITMQVDEVVVRLNGLALVENATVVRRRALDDALWAAGGTTLLLRWIEKATTATQLELAVGLLVEALKDSWRLNEEAEERHAYEILAMHLRTKASLITASVHDSVFELAGFDLASPSRSVVRNTLAVQHLILDFPLWSETDTSVQRAHFDRLRVLITTSDLAAYNLKKLTKLHVVRKIVSALRSKVFESALGDEVVDFLMLVVRSTFTTDSIRYLATYLAAALTTDAQPAPASAPTSLDADTSLVFDARTTDPGPERAALRILQHLHDLLLDPDQPGALSKWSRHVRTKWALALLQDDSTPPLAAVLVVRILVRLLQTQGQPHVAKFANSDSGFAILRAALPRLWTLAQLHLALFALLHGHDITTVPLDAPFQASTLLASSGKAIAAAPEVLRIIVAVVGQGLRALERAQRQPAPDAKCLSFADDDVLRAEREHGFGVIVDLVAQAGRTTADEADWPLLSSPVALSELIRVLRPVLHLSSAHVRPAGAELSPLPLLAASRGFELQQADAANGDKAAPDVDVSFHPALDINSTPTGRDAGDSPRAALDARSLLDDPSTTCSAAILVLGLLAQHVTHGIMARHVRQASSITPTLAQFASSDPSLQPLRIVLDAGASSDARSQVIFRTLLFKQVLHRLSRASTAPVVAVRVSALVEVATDLAVQGWIADIPSVLGFVLAYFEKLLDETALVASPVRAGSIDVFFSCSSRLILLGLLDPASIAVTLDLLAKHQLVAFSPQNEDVDKVRLILHRLARLARTPEHADSAMHVLRLFALQRPPDVDAVFCRDEQDGASEVSVVTQIVEADNGNLVALVEAHAEQLKRTDPSWFDFLVEESAHGYDAVVAELERMQELAEQLEQKGGGQSRRLRKRRRSVSDWKSSVQEQDRARAAHAKQDRAEQKERVAAEWASQLNASEPQPFGFPGVVVSLDFTEGPHRQRKKLLVEKVADTGAPAREAASSSPRLVSRSPASPTSELCTPSRPSSPSVDADEVQHAQDESRPKPEPEIESALDEDKQRKIVRLLEAGDEFQAVYNVSSIRGVDSYPALLLVGRKNLYLVDGYHITAAGEVVESFEAPDEERDPHLQTLADLAGRNTRSSSSNAHVARRWTWTDLAEVHERRFLFRNCALELFFADGHGVFLTFSRDRQAEALVDLADRCPHAVASGSLSFTDPSFGGKLGDALLGQRTKLERMTKRWEQRQISNFEYLMFLNTSSGRSYYDLTCYPVMPWILADYESQTLDLDDPNSFRDLSKPMGCQNEERKREFMSRFDQLGELGEDGPPPFHYGTHYTSAITVTGYLMRLAPFTEAYLDLQGGSYDHADRMFWSVKRAWESASAQNRSDVRELTPEFFYLPDFLVNSNHLDFGRRQESDEPIDNVALPPWANGDARRFIELHREALESEQVSAHLHGWIDLVFGFKQRGQAAVEAVNVFSALSYEGAIDLDAVTDADERKAACSTIHSFGQTPRQLFAKPHPARRPRLKPRSTHHLFAPDLAVEQAAPLLVQCILPILSLASPSPIAFIHPPPSSSAPEKVRVDRPQVLAVPHVAGLILQYGFLDGSLRVFEKGVTVPVTLREGAHASRITFASFADASTLVTGSDDSSICVWRLDIHVVGSSKSVHLDKLVSLRGLHSSPIVSLAASKAYSIIVSGDASGVAGLWDLNRLKPVRVLDDHGEGIQAISISETTGDFATCAGSALRTFTVNGVLLTMYSMGSAAHHVTALAWTKSETAPLVATGLSSGRISIFKRVSAPSTSTGWSLEIVSSLRLDDRLAAHGPPSSRHARRSLAPQDGTDGVTALSFSSRALYAGSSSGKVYLFNPPPTELFLGDAASSVCMACTTKFGLVEPRRRCAACAGLFCGLCTTRSVDAGGRFCSDCFSTLSPLFVQ